MTGNETVKKEGENLVKLRNLFVLNALLGLAFGVGFVLLPGTMLELYGMEQTLSANLAGQLFGVELIVVGLLCWLVREIPDSAARRGIMLALLISDVVGLIVVLRGTLSGVMNAMGWSGVAIYLVLAAGYAYFRFLKPSSS
jgi:hypothetical protein